MLNDIVCYCPNSGFLRSLIVFISAPLSIKVENYYLQLEHIS